VWPIGGLGPADDCLPTRDSHDSRDFDGCKSQWSFIHRSIGLADSLKSGTLRAPTGTHILAAAVDALNLDRVFSATRLAAQPGFLRWHRTRA
jgi:hypothetical protein